MTSPTFDAYTQLITLLDQNNAQYRLIDHEPEGRTDIVSPMRGNALPQAAKCIILMVKLGKKVTRYVLAVVPGDARVDLNAIKAPISHSPHLVLLNGWRAAWPGRSCRLRSVMSWN
jgi:prolyl-tRNA editing enzyme YbaK/EbsC (Cys-tRNA(Pro) deacylase)